MGPALKALPLAPTPSWDGQYLTSRRFLVREGCVIGGSDCPHDLFVEFWLDKRGLDLPNATPGVVTEAFAAVVAHMRQPYATVLKQGRYSRGSVVDLALRSEEPAATAKTFHILESVEVAYRPIRDRWIPYIPFGFHIHPTFWVHPAEEIASKKLHLTVASRLDRPLHWDDGERPERFATSDTLGPIRSWGSNEWWRGNEETVKANKAKYLKRKGD